MPFLLTSLIVCRATGAAGTYVWGGLCRIDVLDAPLTASLAFYGAKSLRVQAMPLCEGKVGEQSDAWLSCCARNKASLHVTYAYFDPC